MHKKEEIKSKSTSTDREISATTTTTAAPTTRRRRG
jgi:hypothetical protein